MEEASFGFRWGHVLSVRSKSWLCLVPSLFCFINKFCSRNINNVIVITPSLVHEMPAHSFLPISLVVSVLASGPRGPD